MYVTPTNVLVYNYPLFLQRSNLKTIILHLTNFENYYGIKITTRASTNVFLVGLLLPIIYEEMLVGYQYPGRVERIYHILKVKGLNLSQSYKVVVVMKFLNKSNIPTTQFPTRLKIEEITY